MLSAFPTVALGPDVPRDCLPASTPGEDEVNDRLFDRLLGIRHEIDIVLWTSLPGFHEDRPAGLRDDPAEVLMPFPRFLFRSVGLLRVCLPDAGSPTREGSLCGPQNPLELAVDRLPAFGGDPL